MAKTKTKSDLASDIAKTKEKYLPDSPKKRKSTMNQVMEFVLRRKKISDGYE